MSGVYRWCYQWPGVTLVYVLCVLWCMLVSECRMDPAAATVGGTAPGTTDVKSVCTLSGCNCTTEHKYWTIVNCSLDSKQIVELHAGILPEKTIELSITGGQEVKLHANLFTDLKGFQRLRTDSTKNIVVKKHAFLNLTVNSLLVQLDTCTSLVFETSAFKNMKGPVTIRVSRCGDVRIQGSVFSFLQDATFQDILRLELAKEAFALPPREIGRHGPVTTIKFRKVMIPSIPTDTFKSSLVEVNLVDSEVREVESEAFSGNTIVAVKTLNTSLHLIRSGAFSERTLMDNLIISNCRLHKMESAALHSAVTNLTIQHSKINTVYTGAINTTIATVVIRHNEIDKLHSKGFSIHDWNRMNIDNNVFHNLDEQSFDSVQNSRFAANHDQYEFSFTGNQVGELATGALKFFSDIVPNVSNARCDSNFFTYPCLCEVDKWLALVIGDSSAASFAAANFCNITTTLAQCYDTVEGRMNMRNFTDTYCGNAGEVMKCKTFSADANVGINENEDNSNLILGLILGLVLLIAVCGTVVILLIHGGLWLKRKGYCVRFRNFNYRTEEESTEAEDIIIAVDRPPENIPEELTQDLLQALRVKLEDPTTYNEAREMIERLYDHFIIEDSYTNNNRQEEETHLYEELGNLPPASADVDKSTPTRPFSFLRLIEERFNLNPTEASSTPRPSVLVDEYSEPKDAQVHLYSELPQNGKEGKQNEINEGITEREQMNSSLRSTGSGRMAYRPLPDKPKTTPAGPDPGEGPSTKF